MTTMTAPTVSVHVLTCALTGALLLEPATAIAQADRPRPITWCQHSESKNNWARQDIVIVLAQSEHEHNYTLDRGAGADAPRLSDPVVGLILESVVSRVKSASPLTWTGGAIPQGDERYTPAVLRTAIDFTLRGDGTLEGFLTAEPSDTALAGQLMRAVRESGDAHELIMDGDTASRYDFDVWVATSPSGRAWWRAFTMYAPLPKAALVRRQVPRIRYPERLLDWEAEFVMQLVVGHNGKARRETIKVVPAIDSYQWPTHEERDAFIRFIDVVKLAISQWEYYPAVVAGCKVDQLTQQKFTFSRP